MPKVTQVVSDKARILIHNESKLTWGLSSMEIAYLSPHVRWWSAIPEFPGLIGRLLICDSPIVYPSFATLNYNGMFLACLKARTGSYFFTFV